MAEKLTKTAIKQELQRRIDWFEGSYKFNRGTNILDLTGKSHHEFIAFSRYRTFLDMQWQIENNLFIGGFAT